MLELARKDGNYGMFTGLFSRIGHNRGVCVVKIVTSAQWRSPGRTPAGKRWPKQAAEEGEAGHLPDRHARRSGVVPLSRVRLPCRAARARRDAGMPELRRRALRARLDVRRARPEDMRHVSTTTRTPAGSTPCATGSTEPGQYLVFRDGERVSVMPLAERVDPDRPQPDRRHPPRRPHRLAPARARRAPGATACACSTTAA